MNTISRPGRVGVLLMMAAVVAVSCMALSPAQAGAKMTRAQYRASYPRYDAVLMTRVALTRDQLGDSVGLCNATGSGLLLFMTQDHDLWARKNWKSSSLSKTWSAIRRGPNRECRWLRSSKLQSTYSGAVTLWAHYQYARYFKNFQDALKVAECEVAWVAVESALGQLAPEVVNQIKVDGIIREFVGEIITDAVSVGSNCGE